MDTNKAIVITGTSTGIGRACALCLDKIGLTVYAGVRNLADGNSLKKEASDRLHPILLDVTDIKSIETAVNTITKETGGKLHGLVNNAGIGRGGALEVTPIEEIKKVMDVNVIGLMAVTKAFIPMLRKAKGRIINIGSTANYLAVPGSSAYSASKFAVRAITDVLRLELKHFGISVILISPGAIETSIWAKGLEYRKNLHKTIKPEIAELYTMLKKFGDRIYKEIEKIPAIDVAKEVMKALTSKKPKRYYIVGKDAKGAAMAAKLPTWFLDWLIYKRMHKMGR